MHSNDHIKENWTTIEAGAAPTLLWGNHGILWLHDVLAGVLYPPQAKHLQFVSGVHITSYWTSTFAWDLINASVPVILSIVMFAAFQVDAYSGDGLLAVAILLVCTLLHFPWK